MRLKKMSQMRLKKGGVGGEVVEEMWEEPDKRLAQMRLKKDVVWDPRLVKGLNRNCGPDIFCSDLIIMQVQLKFACLLSSQIRYYRTIVQL